MPRQQTNTLMTQCRYGSWLRSAGSKLRGWECSLVASNPSAASSCSILCSTAGAWEIRNLQASSSSQALPHLLQLVLPAWLQQCA